MKRTLTLLLTLAVALWVSSPSAAAAQGRGSRPMSTGIEHAESTASSNGQRGIDKAEAKQNIHKHAKKIKGKKAGKKLAKGKSKVKRA